MLLLTAAKHLQEISSSAAPSMIWIYHPHLPAYGSGLNQSPHLFFLVRREAKPSPVVNLAFENCFQFVLDWSPVHEVWQVLPLTAHLLKGSQLFRVERSNVWFASETES